MLFFHACISYASGVNAYKKECSINQADMVFELFNNKVLNKSTAFQLKVI